MRGVLYLTLCHLRRNRLRSAILAACLALAVYLPTAGAWLVHRYEADLTARALATPMVLGAKGNRYDLVLTVLHLRTEPLDTVPWSAFEDLRAEGDGVPIPLHLRFTARGRPVVGTSPEYFELRDVRPQQGTLPLMLGEACVGADVARDLQLAPGSHLFTDPSKLYDLAVPPSLKLRICGVLPPLGSPDDGAVFVDTKTAWILDGFAHAHSDVQQGLDESLVLKRDGQRTTVSEGMIEFNEITAANAASFHFHGDPTTLPLTAVLFVPNSPKAATMVKTRVNVAGRWQMLVPIDVVSDLIAFVFRIKRLFDSLALLLGGITLALTALVLVLAARLRGREMLTLHRLGCSPRTVAKMYATEIAVIATVGMAAAACALLLTIALLPSPTAWVPRP